MMEGEEEKVEEQDRLTVTARILYNDDILFIGIKYAV